MIFRGHRVKNEKKTISNCRGTVWRWRTMVQRDRNISNRLHRRPHTIPRCPMVIRYFFPNVHANTPFTYVPPSDRYRIHPLLRNENKGSCDPAVWGHVYEKLSHPLETIIGIYCKGNVGTAPQLPMILHFDTVSEQIFRGKNVLLVIIIILLLRNQSNR